MTLRNISLAVLAVTVLLNACGGGAEIDPTPAPPAADADSLQRWRDSVDAAAREAAAAAASDEAAAAEARRARALADARDNLEQPVYFDYDASEIRMDQREIMRLKAEILNASPQVQIRLEGHADERGSTEYNIALGNRRAVAVRDFLTGFGLPEARFALVSFGEEQPAVRRSDEAAWSQNRRVEFRITAGAQSINLPNR